MRCQTGCKQSSYNGYHGFYICQGMKQMTRIWIIKVTITVIIGKVHNEIVTLGCLKLIKKILNLYIPASYAVLVTHIWFLLIKRIPKPPQLDKFDEVLTEIFKVTDKAQILKKFLSCYCDWKMYLISATKMAELARWFKSKFKNMSIWDALLWHQFSSWTIFNNIQIYLFLGGWKV